MKQCHIDVCKLRVTDQIWSEHTVEGRMRESSEKINPFTLRHPKSSSDDDDDDDDNNNNNNNFLCFLDDKDLSLAA